MQTPNKIIRLKTNLFAFLLVFVTSMYKAQIPQEDKLDLFQMPVSSSDANQQIAKGIDYISFGITHTLQSCVYAEFIPRVELEKLRDSAIALYLNTAAPTCSNFITAIRIFFGGENNALKLFFQPMYLCSTNTNNGWNTYRLNSNSVYKTIYIFDEGVFKKQDTSVALQYYKDNLIIDRFLSSGIRGFRSINNNTGDAGSMIFPFQELFEIIDDNKKRLKKFNQPLAKGLKIWNVAYRDLIGTQVYTKHSLLLSSDQFGSGSSTGTSIISFAGKYGDKANLCPPDCDEVFYKKE